MAMNDINSSSCKLNNNIHHHQQQQHQQLPHPQHPSHHPYSQSFPSGSSSSASSYSKSGAPSTTTTTHCNNITTDTSYSPSSTSKKKKKFSYSNTNNINNGNSSSNSSSNARNTGTGGGGFDEKIGIYESIEAQLSHLGKRKTWLGIFLGQLCSGFLCLSAITNVYLIDVYSVRLPNAQNFAFYLLLSLVFTSLLAFRRGERNLFPVLRLRGWKYALVAFCDVEGSFLLVKAYQFTTITSVQLLDCFTIPTVLSFSWLILRIRFRVPHILGVSICLLGISCLVWADVESDGRYMGTGKDRFIGDMFCLSGAFLYGISGVAQEFIVKTFDVIEFLGMLGLLGSFISGIQTIILEYSTVADSNWNLQVIILIIVYGFGQFCLHCFTACVIKISSITAVCLSLLSADFYVVMLGIQLFQYKFHPLYFLSFIFVMCGVIIFAIKPTTTMPHLYRSLVREQMTITTDLELLASSNSSHSIMATTGAVPVTTSGHHILQQQQHHQIQNHHPFDNNYSNNPKNLALGDFNIEPITNNVVHFADISSEQTRLGGSICEINNKNQQDIILTPNHSNNTIITNNSSSSNSNTSNSTCSNNSQIVETKQQHQLLQSSTTTTSTSSPLNLNNIEKQNNAANGGTVTSFTYAIPEHEIC